ncbi:cytochrome P450 [Actinokineospora soli]
MSARERLRDWRPPAQRIAAGPGEALPPGPGSHGAVQSMGVWADRNRYFPRMRERYGDTFTLRVAPIGTIVVACASEDVRRIALGGPEVFPIGAQNAIFEPLLGKRTVLALDGPEHVRERKRMMPALHGSRVDGVKATMARLTEEEVARWPVDQPFSLLERLRELTLRVIVRVIMGVDEDGRADRLRPVLRRVVDIRTVDLFMWVWPELSRVGPWKRAVEALDLADELLDAEIALRRADPDRAGRPDVLSMLLDGDPDDDQVRVELTTLLAGGFETTAVAAGWMFERLLRHPAALARVKAGLDVEDDPYRAAVVKETLRLRQVSYNVGRLAAQPVDIGDYRVPAGTFVWPSLAAVHSDKAIWGADAGLFRPERWLEPDPPHRYFLPFGGGAHRCLGAQFALTEMEVILRTVLRAADLVPDRRDDEAPVMRNIITVPKRGVRVRVTAKT